MADRGLRVTVEDLETGHTETAEVPMNEYLILTTGQCRVQTDITPSVTTLRITGRTHPFGRSANGGEG